MQDYNGLLGLPLFLDCFFKYLQLEGLVPTDLSAQILAVRIYRNELLEQGLTRDEIKQVLEEIDSDSPHGMKSPNAAVSRSVISGISSAHRCR